MKMLTSLVITFALFRVGSSVPLDCVCGEEGASTRMVNGIQVAKGKYPWMIALFKLHPKLAGRFSQVCGATVINNQWLLTAAHCIANMTPSDIYAVRSQVDITIINDNNFMRVDKIWFHPKFIGHADNFHEDIALLRLKKTIKFSKDISPICLPATDELYFDNLFNIGWGQTSVDESNSMQLLYIDTYQHDVCYRMYAHLGFWKKQMCTYSVGKGICQGDSGGPLSTRKNRYVTQVGINSWVITGTCGQNPDVSTRVTSYLDDIYKVTKNSKWCRNPNLGE